MSEGDHLASAARQFVALGKPARARQVDPDLPPFPWALGNLWDLFNELSMGISSNGMSSPVVTWLDVESYERACDHDLLPWERRALVRLGNLRASILSEEASKPRDPPAASPKKRT